jgi:hypothetical protein
MKLIAKEKKQEESSSESESDESQARGIAHRTAAK